MRSDSFRSRAEQALSKHWNECSRPEIVDRWVGGTHTQRFGDNLMPYYPQDLIREIRAQIGEGAGSELRPTRNNKRPAHAPYSSAALAANSFGLWMGDEARLRVAGIGGFASLRFEAKQQIAHNGGTPNFDVLLEGDGLACAVEAKLVETCSQHKPTAWRAPYKEPEMRELLSGGWQDLFDACLQGRWHPLYLDVEQLIKHALALDSRQHSGEQRHLVYCYWKPGNASKHPEVTTHYEEVERCRETIGNAAPAFHAITWNKLFGEWGDLSEPPSFLPGHVAALVDRYIIDVPH